MAILALCAGALNAAQQSVWNDSTVPAQPTVDDRAALELGVRFSVGTTGTIDAVRFYRGQQGNGLYQVNLWRADGTLLGSGNVYEGLPGAVPGWQQIPLAAPVAVQPGDEYVVSYFHSEGAYAFNADFFTAPLSSGQILLPIDAGVYRYGGSSSFPDQVYRSANYWVAPVFSATTVTPTTSISPPFIFTLDTISASAINVRFAPGGIGSSENAGRVPRHLFYLDGQYVGVRPNIDVTLARLTVPADGLPHTVAIRGQADDGTLSEPSPLRTVTPPPARTLADGPFGLFAPHVGPNFTLADRRPTEVGQGIRAAVSGSVSGVRFYKSDLATGPFVGSLWTADGQLIATTASTAHSGFGYRDLPFAQPVQLNAGQSYVVSYFTPNGLYAYSQNYFTPGAVDFFPLASTTPGLRRIGSAGFPDATDETNACYFVDVIFDVALDQRGTLFAADVVPDNVSAWDPNAVELGVGITPTVDGTIDAVRFYRGVAEPEGYTVSVWADDGTLLATAFRADDGSTGWIEVTVPPVTVSAGSRYVVSYLAANGGYAYTYDYFAQPTVTPLLVAAAGSNGLYTYGGGFPTSTYRLSNYWVDAVFTPDGATNALGSAE